MIESKFTKKIYLLAMIPAIFLINSVVLIWFATQNHDGPNWAIMLIPFGFLVPLFFAYQVVKNQIAKVSIGHGHIKRKTLFGYDEDFRINHFQCFRTIKIRSKHGLFEHLHLIKDGKRVITISESMHSNYPLLKQEIAKQIEFGGEIKFNFFGEIKAFFKK